MHTAQHGCLYRSSTKTAWLQITIEVATVDFDPEGEAHSPRTLYHTDWPCKCILVCQISELPAWVMQLPERMHSASSTVPDHGPIMARSGGDAQVWRSG